MVISEIALYEVLAKELGSEKAKALVEYVEHKIDREFESSSNILTTKEDLAITKAELKEEIANVRTELKGEIANVRTELKGEIAGVRTEIANIRTEINAAKVETLRWTFSFIILIILAIIGLYFKH